VTTGDEPPKSGVAWKVATGVCALLAAGALAWGFMQKSEADTAAQDSAAEVARLQAEIEADKQQEAEVEEALSEAKAAHEEVAKKLKTKGKELKQEASQLKSLQNQYNQAAKEAAQRNATLKDELAAQEAKTALATKCAQVLATGMEVIYNATTPEEVMNDVAKEMQRAAQSCQGVVSFS
jgi:septal ring factor EnvC (AmiA/AmiB activator)